MEIIRAVRNYLTLNRLVARADVLYELCKEDQGHRSLAADYYLLAAVYADAATRSEEVIHYLSCLERCVSVPYDAAAHYLQIREGRSSAASLDRKRLAAAVALFHETYPHFAIGDFLEKQEFWVRRMRQGHSNENLRNVY